MQIHKTMNSSLDSRNLAIQKFMASVKLMLNKSRALHDGRYPLVFQIIHRRRKKLIYTPYKLFDEEFDADASSVRFAAAGHSRREVREMNDYLKVKRQEIAELLGQMEQTRPGFTVDDLVQSYHCRQDESYLFTYAGRHIATLEQGARHGTAAAYRSTVRSLGEFTDGVDVRFTEIDPHFVRSYRQFLIGRGVSANTVCFYLRNLRSLYNQASADGIPVGPFYPFRSVPIRIAKTAKRALSRESLQRIARFDLSESPDLELARDLFLFSYYTRGMSFVDIVHLCKRNISGGTISYFRSKTKQHLQITVTEPLARLIAKYANDSEYVFPLLASCGGEGTYGKYRSALGFINRRLKTIGQLLRLGMPLTTYVARHSWATAAKELGTPVSVISEGLGHTTEKTTQIYLRSFDHTVIDRVNEEVSRL